MQKAVLDHLKTHHKHIVRVKFQSIPSNTEFNFDTTLPLDKIAKNNSPIIIMIMMMMMMMMMMMIMMIIIIIIVVIIIMIIIIIIHVI